MTSWYGDKSANRVALLRHARSMKRKKCKKGCITFATQNRMLENAFNWWVLNMVHRRNRHFGVHYLCCLIKDMKKRAESNKTNTRFSQEKKAQRLSRVTFVTFSPNNPYFSLIQEKAETYAEASEMNA